MNIDIETLRNKYLANPVVCPYCDSRNLDGDILEVDGTTAWQSITCGKCGKEWEDIYTLTNVEFQE